MYFTSNENEIAYIFEEKSLMGLFFIEERDKYFLEVCDKIQKENKFWSVSKVAKAALLTETFSFFLTIRGYAKIIHKLRKCEPYPSRSVKCEMYDEIKERVAEMPQDISVNEMARRLDTQTAPRFYMTENSAIQLYYNLIKKRNEVHRRDDFYTRNFNFR